MRTREIDARRLLPRRVHVVDDVDAADEGDLAVDVAELAVQPPQPVRAELPRRDLGAVLEQAARRPLRACVSIDGGEVVLRAPAVHEHAHDDAALRGAHERGRRRSRRRRRRRRCTSRARLRAPRRRSRGPARESTRRRSSTKLMRLPGQEPVHRRRGAAPCRTWRRAPRGRRCVPDGNA